MRLCRAWAKLERDAQIDTPCPRRSSASSSGSVLRGSSPSMKARIYATSGFRFAGIFVMPGNHRPAVGAAPPGAVVPHRVGAAPPGAAPPARHPRAATTNSPPPLPHGSTWTASARRLVSWLFQSLLPPLTLFILCITIVAVVVMFPPFRANGRKTQGRQRRWEFKRKNSLPGIVRKRVSERVFGGDGGSRTPVQKS